MSELRGQVLSGAGWTIGMRAVVNGLGMISTIILARLLTPGDFGLTALAGSAYIFFSVLGQFGFDTALIHFKDPTEEHYSSAWTANILVGLLVAVAMVLVALPAARFFEDPRLANVIYAFSALSLAKGFENIGVVNFRKELKFKGDFYYFVIPKVTSFIAGIGFTLYFRNYWGLVSGMISGQIATLIYSHISQPLRPKICFSRVHELLKFSKWVVATNIVQFFSEKGLEVMLGKIKNASAVGVYGMAKQIAQLPASELLAPVNRVIFPALSKISDDLEQLRRLALIVMGSTAIITIPASLGLAAIADQVVFVLLGEKWSAVAPVLQLLSLAGVWLAIRSIFHPIMLARGRPEVYSYATAFSLLLLLPAAAYLISLFGVIGLAAAELGVISVVAPLVMYVACREIALPPSQVIRALWRPIISSLLMVWVIEEAAWLNFGLSQSPFIALLATVFTAILTYFLLLTLLWASVGCPSGGESYVINLLRENMWRMRGTSEKL